MKYLRLLLKSLQAYFVFRRLKKGGFIKEDYTLTEVLLVSLRNMTELEKSFRGVDWSEKKQSES
ncbi:hypothetical protein V6948_10590 [Fusobacterium varium]|uniref:hypothetical protein n=1 Tax=Fusobacterium varium TaxID=856 RepID=UPI002FF2C533